MFSLWVAMLSVDLQNLLLMLPIYDYFLRLTFTPDGNLLIAPSGSLNKKRAGQVEQVMNDFSTKQIGFYIELCSFISDQHGVRIFKVLLF